MLSEPALKHITAKVLHFVDMRYSTSLHAVSALFRSVEVQHIRSQIQHFLDLLDVQHIIEVQPFSKVNLRFSTFLV